MRAELGDLTLKLTEVATEYTHYRLKTQTDIAELEDKLMKEKQNSAESIQSEELKRQLRDKTYQLSQKEEEIEKLKAEYKASLKIAQDKTIELESDLRAKDKYIDQLHDENDEFKSNLEKLGFETFLQLKNDLFAKE